MKFGTELLYVVILCFLGWCAYTFRADIAQIQFASIWAAKDAIFLAMLLSLLNYVSRAGRWRLYLSRLGYPLPYGYSWLTYVAGFAFTLSPGKVGEMARGQYLKKAGIPLSGTAGAFFIERLMDMLAILVLALMGFAAASAYSSLIWGAVIVTLSLVAILAMSGWARVAEYLERAHWLSPSMKNILHGVVRALMSSQALLTPQLLLTGFVIGVIAWGSEGIGLMVIGAMVPNVAMDWMTAIKIYSIATIVGALSFLPGGLGGTEAVMVALLMAHGYAIPAAILLTFVCRLLTLWFAVLIGWIAVAVLRYSPIQESVSQ